MQLIFVYGTLKRGGENHHHFAGQTFIDVARTAPGYRLFELGGFPGMVEHAVDRDGVVGEVWSVDAQCLRRLDELEGVAEGLYQRKRVPLLPPFANQDVAAYFYPHSVAGRTEIGSVWTAKTNDP